MVLKDSFKKEMKVIFVLQKMIEANLGRGAAIQEEVPRDLEVIALGNNLPDDFLHDGPIGTLIMNILVGRLLVNELDGLDRVQGGVE